jgi:hypothetical protein
METFCKISTQGGQLVMKKFLSRVTVTGADDSVTPYQLIELAQEFPFVEFGILISRGSMGERPRFPSSKWLSELADARFRYQPGVTFHICGEWAREILMGSWPSVEFSDLYIGFIEGMSNRWQIETPAEPYEVDYDKLSKLMRGLDAKDENIIFQYNEVNIDTFKHLVTADKISQNRKSVNA